MHFNDKFEIEICSFIVFCLHLIYRPLNTNLKSKIVANTNCIFISYCTIKLSHTRNTKSIHFLYFHIIITTFIVIFIKHHILIIRIIIFCITPSFSSTFQVLSSLSSTHSSSKYPAYPPLPSVFSASTRTTRIS